jgi:multisubunit Na+/H+ antiporter MnhF subunit
VNVWLWGATVLLVGLVPCGWVAARDTRVDALVALELAGSVVTLVLVLLSEGFHRASYMDIPVLLAFTSAIGALVVARFLGRHV